MNKKDKSYQIRLQCEKCSKFIDVDLYTKITERDRYGKPETYVPAKIPEYLKIIFIQGMDWLSHRDDDDLMRMAKKLGALGSAGVQNPQVGADEPVIVCKRCQQIKKLTE